MASASQKEELLKLQESVSPSGKRAGAGSKRRVIGASSVERPSLGQNGVSLTNIAGTGPKGASVPTTGTQKKGKSSKSKAIEGEEAPEENPFKIEGDSAEGGSVGAVDPAAKKKRSKKSKRDNEGVVDEAATQEEAKAESAAAA